MEPVVNGLEKTFDDQIEFRQLNANGDGEEAFRVYHLRGHPSYVLIDPTGEVIWTGLGEQPQGNLERALHNALSNTQ